MAQTITLTGNYGYEAYKLEGVTATTIDATSAEWIVANMGANLNLYPVSVRDSNNVILSGGTIRGTVSLTLDWVDAYINSAAVYARNVDGMLIEDWTITKAWDAIRIRGTDADDFTIDNVWLSNVRDDGVENDDGLSGTIRNSLFDGVFVGISLGDGSTPDQTDNVVTLENVLIRMESFLYKGEVTHQSIFKTTAGISPGLRIHDSVFAIEDVSHQGLGRLAIAWDSLISASNNYFLNLSDVPLPASYPRPPSGFTILQGAAARTFWAAARADWIAEHDAAAGVSDITGTSAANALMGTAIGEKISGLAGNDTLNGASGNDTLIGGDGNDLLTGGAGNDRLDGGTGSDTVVYAGTAAALVNLGFVGAQNSGQGTDTFIGIENAQTGSGNDRVTGSALANRLSTGAGNDTLLGGAGNDTLNSNLGTDSLYGGDGNDVLAAGLGNDRIDGGAGSDTAIFTTTAATAINLGYAGAQNTGQGTDTFVGVENALTSSGNDRLTGSGLANRLASGAGNDALSGAGGNDTLFGGAGNDSMTGGTGADRFVFNTAPNALTNADRIADFTHAADLLVFDDAVFASLDTKSGAQNDTLLASQLRLGTAAADANDHLIYTQSTGKLYYDADGRGGLAQILIATLSTTPTLSASDLFII